MKYRNYIFDLYGTLIDIHTDEENPKLWEALASYYEMQGAKYAADELKSAYATGVRKLLDITEEIQVEKVFRTLYEAKGVTPDDALVLETCHFFRDTSTEYIKLYPWTLPMLDS